MSKFDHLFIDPKDIAGKSIKQVVNWTTRLILLFTDGTYTCIAGDLERDGEINLIAKPLVAALDLHLAHLISGQEYKDLWAEQIKEAEESRRASRRKQYDALKAEFEGPSCES